MNNKIKEIAKKIKLKVAKKITEPLLCSLIPGRTAISLNTQENSNISKIKAIPINAIEKKMKRPARNFNLKQRKKKTDALTKKASK